MEIAVIAVLACARLDHTVPAARIVGAIELALAIAARVVRFAVVTLLEGSLKNAVTTAFCLQAHCGATVVATKVVGSAIVTLLAIGRLHDAVTAAKVTRTVRFALAVASRIAGDAVVALFIL